MSRVLVVDDESSLREVLSALMTTQKPNMTRILITAYSSVETAMEAMRGKSLKSFLNRKKDELIARAGS